MICGDRLHCIVTVSCKATCNPGKHCKTTEVGEETQYGADNLWEMVGCMEDDEEGDVEEDQADQVHADDVAMEGVEHGQD